MFCGRCGAESPSGARFCSTCGASLDHARSLADHENPRSDQPHAGFWLRAAAVLIDGILCQVTSMVVAIPLGLTIGAISILALPIPGIDFAANGIGFSVGLMVHWLWFTVAESSDWQASIGKKMLGLKVTDLNGDRIDFARANLRYWSKILSGLFFGFGFFMVAFTESKQGLHDKLAGTLVLRDVND